MTRSALLSVLVTLSVVIVGASPGGAQQMTLADALARLSPGAARHAPLLIVDPAGTTPAANRPSLPDPPPAGGYPLRALAARFDRKIVNLGTVSVLVPATMTVLNFPGPPERFAGLGRSLAAQRLLASFRPDQWRLAGGEAGIGAGDLDADQRAFFQATLPDPFLVRKVASSGRGSFFVAPNNENLVALSPEQRVGIRLRLSRSISWGYATKDANGKIAGSLSFGSPVASEDATRPEGTEFFTQLSQDSPDPLEAALQTIRQTLPSRLKPGHLDFNAPGLNAVVTLQSNEKLGELVGRIGQTVNTELIADARVAALFVRALGRPTQARAGDVLKALCYALCGTFRRVEENTFVLTDDIEGIGARRARLLEWADDVSALRKRLTDEAEARMAAHQPAALIPFAPGDPLTLRPDVMQSVESALTKQRYGDADVPVADLPPAAQELVRAQIEEHGKHRPPGTSSPLVSDRVQRSVSVQTTLLVPSVGVLSGPGGVGLRTLLPPAAAAAPSPLPAAAAALPDPMPPRFPAAWAARALFVTPPNAHEAVRAAREARRRGFSQLWISAETSFPLSEAVAAGRQAGVVVFAVVSLLRRPAGQAAAPDINLLGETPAAYAARRAPAPGVQDRSWIADALAKNKEHDWLAPAPDLPSQLAARVTAVRQTPGLAGVVLQNTVAPGYAYAPNAFIDGRSAVADSGYTPWARRAFLRRVGVDPLDIAPAGTLNLSYSVDLSLPFFPDDATLTAPWSAVRAQINARLLADLFAALAAKNADSAAPLFLANRDDPHAAMWFGSWDTPNALPQLLPGKNYVDSARAASRTNLIRLSVTRPETTKTAWAHYLARNFDRWAQNSGGGWSGGVLDLSALPPEKALALVEALAPAGN